MQISSEGRSIFMFDTILCVNAFNKGMWEWTTFLQAKMLRTYLPRHYRGSYMFQILSYASGIQVFNQIRQLDAHYSRLSKPIAFCLSKTSKRVSCLLNMQVSSEGRSIFMFDAILCVNEFNKGMWEWTTFLQAKMLRIYLPRHYWASYVSNFELC